MGSRVRFIFLTTFVVIWGKQHVSADNFQNKLFHKNFENQLTPIIPAPTSLPTVKAKRSSPEVTSSNLINAPNHPSKSTHHYKLKPIIFHVPVFQPLTNPRPNYDTLSFEPVTSSEPSESTSFGNDIYPDNNETPFRHHSHLEQRPIHNIPIIFSIVRPTKAAILHIPITSLNQSPQTLSHNHHTHLHNEPLLPNTWTQNLQTSPSSQSKPPCLHVLDSEDEESDTHSTSAENDLSPEEFENFEPQTTTVYSSTTIVKQEWPNEDQRLPKEITMTKLINIIRDKTKISYKSDTVFTTTGGVSEEFEKED